MEPIVLVDAENVRRSVWPNLGQEQLVELCRAWARANTRRILVVFDGPAPVEADDVLGSDRESADDVLVRLAAAERAWLVTSDRELRERAAAERTIGGGSFARELTA